MQSHNQTMPRRSPPTPGLEASSDSDFVILPRHTPLPNGVGNQQTPPLADFDLQSQLLPLSMNMGTTGSYVTMIQYDQLVSVAQAMKDENNMLKEQLNQMMIMIESRTKEFLTVKNSSRKATERCREIRRKANEEVMRLRRLNEQLQARLQALMPKEDFRMLPSISAGPQPTHESASSLAQPREGVQDAQATQRYIQEKIADLEGALKSSANEIRHYKQRATQLQLEKQDLLNLNNELQTMVSAHAGTQLSGSASQVVAGVGSPTVYDEGTECYDKHLENQTLVSQPDPHKSSVALQDVLLQLQAEREKVASLMEEVKKERDNSDRVENAMREQMQFRSGEHSMVVESIKKKHRSQVEELCRQLDELALANQEPHHSMELKHQVTSLVFELQERENVLHKNAHELQDLQALNEALKSKISLYHDEMEKISQQDSKMIETLRLELHHQQGLLQTEKQKTMVGRNNYQKLREEHRMLFADFDNLSHNFDKLSQTKNTQTASQVQVRELSEQRDDLTAHLISAEEAIDAKIAELERSQQELKAARAQIEAIPVLEAQAEIYKNDFDAERAAREKSHTEREVLVAKLDELTEANQQLRDQLARHNQDQLKQMQDRHGNTKQYGNGGDKGYYESYIKPIIGGRSRSKTQDDYELIPRQPLQDTGFDVDKAAIRHGPLTEPDRASPSGKEVSCPKCMHTYPDIDTLQIHILDCIE